MVIIIAAIKIYLVLSHFIITLQQRQEIWTLKNFDFQIYVHENILTVTFKIMEHR